MKRKIKWIFLIAAIIGSFTACEEDVSYMEKPVDYTGISEVQESASPETMPTPTPAPTPAPTPTPQPTQASESLATKQPASSESEIRQLPVQEPSETSPVISEKPSESSVIVKSQIEIPQTAGYPELNFGSPYTDSGNLTNKKMSWYFNRNKTHTPPSAQGEFDIRQFGGYYLGDTSQKNAYLTFDEGYENGYTEKILDVLLEKEVTAAFFVTKTYITANPDLILRMVNEGHIVGNHSVTHPSFPDLSDGDVVWELTETEKAFKELTGLDMPKFFRPPMGEYSARTLAITANEGYKTIFWSFAYRDWETDNQPGKQSAYNTIMSDLHNGQISLLHAVSKSNTEALPDVIDSYRENGYKFLSLNDLP